MQLGEHFAISSRCGSAIKLHEPLPGIRQADGCRIIGMNKNTGRKRVLQEPRQPVQQHLRACLWIFLQHEVPALDTVDGK